MNSVEKVKLAELVEGGVCIAAEDGDKVCEHVTRLLKKGGRVEMSFDGVEELTSLFLNCAIGRLYGEFSEIEVRNLLSVCDISSQDLATLKRCVDRAKEYYRDPDRFHRAADEVLGNDDD